MPTHKKDQIHELTKKELWKALIFWRKKIKEWDLHGIIIELDKFM